MDRGGQLGLTRGRMSAAVFIILALEHGAAWQKVAERPRIRRLADAAGRVKLTQEHPDGVG